MTTRSSGLPRLLAVAAALTVAACSTTVVLPETAGTGGETLTLAVGQQVTVTLRTIGPGPAYDTLPGISSSSVRFVGITPTPDSLINPGGPVQLFVFTAQSRGQAVLTFRRTGTTGVTSDIVNVQ